MRGDGEGAAHDHRVVQGDLDAEAVGQIALLPHSGTFCGVHWGLE